MGRMECLEETVSRQCMLISLALKQRFASRAKELPVDELTATYR